MKDQLNWERYEEKIKTSNKNLSLDEFYKRNFRYRNPVILSSNGVICYNSVNVYHAIKNGISSIETVVIENLTVEYY